ncbi:MAG: hypothetical protein GX847_03825 [Clostridiales bacterium]|nr:hypothetical protein [Clostridiales bacterium]
MSCRSVTSKRNWSLLLAGAVLLAVGLTRFLSDPGADDVSALLLGVFTGMGGAFVCVGVIRLVRLAVRRQKS